MSIMMVLGPAVVLQWFIHWTGECTSILESFLVTYGSHGSRSISICMVGKPIQLLVKGKYQELHYWRQQSRSMEIFLQAEYVNLYLKLIVSKCMNLLRNKLLYSVTNIDPFINRIWKKIQEDATSTYNPIQS